MSFLSVSELGCIRYTLVQLGDQICPDFPPFPSADFFCPLALVVIFIVHLFFLAYYSRSIGKRYTDNDLLIILDSFFDSTSGFKIRLISTIYWLYMSYGKENNHMILLCVLFVDELCHRYMTTFDVCLWINWLWTKFFLDETNKYIIVVGTNLRSLYVHKECFENTALMRSTVLETILVLISAISLISSGLQRLKSIKINEPLSIFRFSIFLSGRFEWGGFQWGNGS